MLQCILDLKFKGDRDYLHGTDIFNNAIARLSDRYGIIENIDFAFPRQTCNELELIVADSPSGSGAAAVCSFVVDGVRRRACLYETPSLVTARYPYREEELVRSMDFDINCRKGILEGSVDYTDIEVWVAMTKALHQKVFSKSEGRWYFVRGRFKTYTAFSCAARREVLIASTFNDKLTRCEVSQDGVKLGEIHFSIA